ncbi:hypothetical protein ES703_14951 [subsurface metagenome]
MTELSRNLRGALEALAKSAEIAREGVDKEPSYAIYLERIMEASEIIGSILGRMAVEAIAKGETTFIDP